MTKEEWTTSRCPEDLLEFLRPTASLRDLRLCAVAFCRRIWQHLTPQCQSAVEFAVDYAQGRGEERDRKAIYSSINDLCIYVEGDSTPEDRFHGFAAEAALSTLYGEEDVVSIKNYAATCAIAASRAVVEVVLAAAELRGCPEAEVEHIVEGERTSHCDIVRSMFKCPVA